MKLVSPETEASEESLQFSLEKPATDERRNGSTAVAVAEAVASPQKTVSVFSCMCEAQQEEKAGGEELPLPPSGGTCFIFQVPKKKRRKQK